MNIIILICSILIVSMIIIIILTNQKDDLKKQLEEKEQQHKEMEFKINYLEGRIEVLSKSVIDPTKIVSQEVYKKALQEKEEVIKYIKKEYGILEELQKNTQEKLDAQLSAKKSQEVRLGKISENIIPFLRDFPYESNNIVSIFRPVDFLVFENDKLIFVEVKTGNSQQTQKQKNIERLIKEGKVYYEIHRLDENGYSIKRD